MTNHIVATLVSRRADLAGQIDTLQGQLNQLHADLASLDAVIHQFDPDYQLATIRPRYRRAPTAAEHGAMSRAVLDVLRRAQGPLSAAEVADQIIAIRGLDGGDSAGRKLMRKRVDMALRYQRTNGMVREVGSVEGAVIWEIEG